MNEKIRLFVDMDGTLAVFNPVAKLETLYEQGYFKNLAPMQNMVEAVKKLASDSKDIEVFVLSSCLDSAYAKQEKNIWLDKNLPMIDTEHRIFCEYGKEKSSFIHDPQRTDILLDDYTKNLKEWHGVGIKILNGINDTNKSWQGQRISSFLEPNILTYTIKNTTLLSITHRSGLRGAMQNAIAKKQEKDSGKTIPNLRKKEKSYGQER